MGCGQVSLRKAVAMPWERPSCGVVGLGGLEMKTSYIYDRHHGMLLVLVLSGGGFYMVGGCICYQSKGFVGDMLGTCPVPVGSMLSLGDACSSPPPLLVGRLGNIF